MLNSKELTRAIQSITRRTKTLRKDIHVVLCNIAGHVYEHNQAIGVKALLNGTKGADKVAIMAWLKENAFIKFDNNGFAEVNKSARKNADFESGAELVEYLLEQAPKWYDDAITTEKAAKLLDPAARIEALAKQVEKADDIALNLRAVEDAIQHLAEAIKVKRQLKAVIAA